VHALHTESSIEVANDVDDRPYTVWHGYKMPPSHKVATSRLLLPSTFPKTNQVDPMSARLPSPRNRHCLAHMACPSFRGAAALPKKNPMSRTMGLGVPGVRYAGTWTEP
jgi:hypothetical protein